MTESLPLRMSLRPSRVLAALVIAGHAAAGASVYLVWPGAAGAVAALLFGLLGTAVAWRVALLRSARSPVTLELRSGGTLRAGLRGGGSLEAGPGRRHVTRHWVILPAGRTPVRHLLVTSGMLGAPDFRRLKVWALWGGLAGRAELN